MKLSAPVLLTDEHGLDDFECGTDSLDEWLKRRARANQISGASRTYVVAETTRVVGYYCLASGALAIGDAPGSIRRNMPDPVPMAVLGRLAVDRTWRGKGLGAALLQDAVIRTAHASGILGIRGFLAHAISADAKAFYEHHGFVSSSTQPMTLILSVRRIG
ncbi:MAG: GNAT family N-acetyltransferase [Sterolibacterium sp.]